MLVSWGRARQNKRIQKQANPSEDLGFIIPPPSPYIMGMLMSRILIRYILSEQRLLGREISW